MSQIYNDYSVREIDDNIQKPERQIESLKEQKKKMESMTPVQQLASFLHKKLCHLNHTDGCDWHYGSWDSPSFAQKRYLEKAEKLLATGMPIEELMNIAELMA